MSLGEPESVHVQCEVESEDALIFMQLCSAAGICGFKVLQNPKRLYVYLREINNKLEERITAVLKNIGWSWYAQGTYTEHLKELPPMIYGRRELCYEKRC